MCREPRLCCSGTMMVGTNFACYFVTCIVYVFYAILSTAYVAPFVSSTFTPYIAYSLGPILSIFCVMVFSLPAWVDPGYLPRSPVPRFPLDPSDTAPVSEADTPSTAKPGEAQQNVIYSIAGANIPAVLCKTCNIVRPPGASHCNTCGHCVMYLDHHCPWVGTDVGFRNHFYFILGTAGIGLYCTWVFVMSITAIIVCIQKSDTDFFTVIIPVVLCIMGSMFGMFFGSMMSASHCGMIAMDTTTRAKLKKTQTPVDIVIQAFKQREDPVDQDLRVVQDIEDTEYNSVVAEIKRNKSFRCKHSGWRRIMTARFMPSLYRRDPLEAEKLAWIWTVALTREDI